MSSDEATIIGYMSGLPSGSPGREVLEDLYVRQMQSYRDIARRYGITATTVKRWFRAAGIPARDTSSATSIAQKGKKLEGRALENSRRTIEIARAARTEETFRKQSVSMMGKPAWNKGKPWTPEHRKNLMVVRRSPEYRQKLSDAQKGEKAHNWRGGVSSAAELHLHGWEWRLRRQECYERDSRTCQDCGATPKPPQRLNAHHLISRDRGGSDELENLVTLCVRCHQKRHARTET